jgi:hypothetical protein
MVAAGLRSLIDIPLTDLQRRNLPNELPRETPTTKDATTVRPQQFTGAQPRTPEEASIIVNTPGEVTLPLVFYSTYIIICLITFFYWQFRKRRA